MVKNLPAMQETQVCSQVRKIRATNTFTFSQYINVLVLFMLLLLLLSRFSRVRLCAKMDMSLNKLQEIVKEREA